MAVPMKIAAEAVLSGRSVYAGGKKTSAPGDSDQASLEFLCDQVVVCSCAYSDVAEVIENKAYDEWKCGKVAQAVGHLLRVARFFEQLENKNEENTGDLAGVYFLIGQLYQYAELYAESVEWLSKSIFVDDGNALPYHCMGISYCKTGNVHDAVRCFEQELEIDGGNYSTYLQLADLYDRAGKSEKAEQCLKSLLVRDTENIQGLHYLIRHYERQDHSITTDLLRIRLLGVAKQFTETEEIIRACYLCRGNRSADALASLTAFARNNRTTPVFYLAKAYVFGRLKRFRDRKKTLAVFAAASHSRPTVMAEHFGAFERIIGETAVRKLKNQLEGTKDCAE
jgi:tetratricopeptide (TPR) repeat protein